MLDRNHATRTTIARRCQEDRRLAALMQAAQDGDARAYASLLQGVTALLRRFVRRRCPCVPPDSVEDRVQEILLSLHQARATYDPERPFTPWLMALARNRMADAARRHARRAGKEIAVDSLETFSPFGTKSHADATIDSLALCNAIEELPPAQRKVIEMVKLREMSLAEVSRANGMSVPALKVTIHRAVKRLRKLMGAEV